MKPKIEVIELNPIRDLSEMAFLRASRHPGVRKIVRSKNGLIDFVPIYRLILMSNQMIKFQSLVLDTPISEEEAQVFEKSEKKICHLLQRIIHSMSRPERKAIRLLYYKNLTPKESAVSMKIRPDVFEKILRSAFEKLRAGVRFQPVLQ